jgi:hypothetical protein
MPSIVAGLMQAAGVAPAGVVRCNRVPLDEPGVYIVAMSGSPDALEVLQHCPISPAAVQQPLDIRPELLLDGAHPARHELVDRLAAMWLGDETVLYLGLAGTSVAPPRRPVLGARRPHAGGWPLPLPFANLTVPRGDRKRHGITGAREPREPGVSTK